MRTLVTGDLHLEESTADMVFACLDEFHATAKAMACEKVVLLGDIWHVRYAAPIAIQSKLGAKIRALAEDFLVAIVPGNHDQDGPMGVNALTVHTGFNVVVYDEPCVVNGVAYLPYRKDPNVLLQAMAANAGKPVRVVYLHHGIVGAKMNNNIVATDTDGIPPAAFGTVPLVVCAHWHRPQIITAPNTRCVYAGSPWQTKSDEAGQLKGFLFVDERTLDFGWQPCVAGRRWIVVDPVNLTDDVVAQLRPQDAVKLTGGDDKATAQAAQKVRATGATTTFSAPPVAGTTTMRGGDLSSFDEVLTRFVQSTDPDNADARLAFFKEELSS